MAQQDARGGPDQSGNAMSAEAKAAGALFLASNRNLPVRIVVACAAVVAALPVMPFWMPFAWLSGVLTMGVVESLIARRVTAGARLPVWQGIPIPSMAMTMSTGVLYGVSATAFWMTGSGPARIFAICQMATSLLYVLLQYYARPRIFLLAATPYLVTVAAGTGNVIATCVLHGKAWQAVTALMSLAILVHFFRAARGQLAASRDALRAARAEAQVRGVAAEAANEAKSAFLATMSHEIRTPLNGVLGMAQAMAADELSPVQRDRLEVVRRSGESLLAILNDVLDLSKIEAGRFELESIPFDLGDLAKGAHSAFTAIANKKGLSFDLTVAPAAQGVYLGDPTRVRQILYNLIANALKFTEQGEVRVTAARDPGGALTLTVADTGCGIEPERLSSLFEKFVQADASTTRKYGGTGLGLAICRELTHLMGGSISAESKAGVGSSFVVSLPLPQVDEAPAAPAAESGTAEAPRLPSLKIRVLAAEDNTVNQLVLKTLLHQIGVEPVVVENGVQAVEAWEASEWDVILMDMQMPEMDGLAATRMIRAGEAAGRRPRTPIIALTANAMSHQIQQCVEAGMDGHVAKPIEARRLFEALAGALEANPAKETAAA